MKLSIITINFNNKVGLQKTIDSVISQTYKEFEWIIIDGGSTDGSKELIEKYSEHITYWVSEPDKGIYNAMNKGIKIAKGEYLQFLNSGDAFYYKKILSDVFTNNKSNHDIITGSIFSNGKVSRGIGYKDVSLNDFFYNSVYHPSSFIKKELFTKIGGYDENYKIASDWKFFIYTIIIKNATLLYIDKPITIFDHTGISSTEISVVKKEKQLILEELFPKRILSDYRYKKNEFLIMNNPITRFIYTFIIKCLKLYNRNIQL